MRYLEMSRVLRIEGKREIKKRASRSFRKLLWASAKKPPKKQMLLNMFDTGERTVEGKHGHKHVHSS